MVSRFGPRCEGAGFFIMNRILFAGVIISTMMVISFSCDSENDGPPETLLFNDTIEWGWPKDVWYGGNSFYWWHRVSEGVTELGEMPPSDWTRPNDFYHGRFHMRFEIINQPSDSTFKVQLGFWQDKDKDGGHSESISSSLYMAGGAEDVVEGDIGSPSEWWNKRQDAPVDFKRPDGIYRIGLALWKTTGDKQCIPMGQGWPNSNACDDPETAAAGFFPMKARVTVVAVADGHTFTGWDNYK
jgi:hypothetical protein